MIQSPVQITSCRLPSLSSELYQSPFYHSAKLTFVFAASTQKASAEHVPAANMAHQGDRHGADKRLPFSSLLETCLPRPPLPRSQTDSSLTSVTSVILEAPDSVFSVGDLQHGQSDSAFANASRRISAWNLICAARSSVRPCRLR